MRNNMRATTLCFALTFALLGASAHANSSDENKYICLDPTEYDGSKEYTGSSGNTPVTYSCDVWINAWQASDTVLNGEVFDQSWSCDDKSSVLISTVNMLASPMGCCGTNGKSACFKNHSYACQNADVWMPDKLYTGPATSGSTMTCTQIIDNLQSTECTGNACLGNEDFTKSWSCDGKSFSIQGMLQTNIAEEYGCCGSGKKSACWVDRSNVCADPSKFLPWNNFKSEDGSFDGTCDFAVHTISKDNTASCHGEDFSQTWSCSGKSSSCQVQLLELARGGCCGSAGQSASACHGHYSGAGSFKQVGIFAISIAVAIALA